MTDVYIGQLQKQKKKINDDSNDKGHIDETLPSIIKYIATSEDDHFMVGKFLKADEAFSSEVFKADEPAPPTGEQEKEGSPEKKKEGEEIKKEADEKPKISNVPKTLFVPDVTKESKLKFFKVPKLGSYLAIAMKYQSPLTEESLDKAVEAFFEMEKKKQEQEAKKTEHDAEIQKQKEEKEAAGEEFKEEKVQWEEIKEPPYQTVEVSYLVGIDTIGKETKIGEREKQFATEIIKHVILCWEDSEKAMLTKDKQKRISMVTKDKEFKEKEYAEMNEAFEKAASEAVAAEEPQ